MNRQSQHKCTKQPARLLLSRNPLMEGLLRRDSPNEVLWACSTANRANPRLRSIAAAARQRLSRHGGVAHSADSLYQPQFVLISGATQDNDTRLEIQLGIRLKCRSCHVHEAKISLR